MDEYSNVDGAYSDDVVMTTTLKENDMSTDRDAEDSAEDSAKDVDVSCDVPRDRETAIDMLLMRHRNEILFELRKLEHGDRPVTGDSERRQAVSNLVSKLSRSSDEQASNTLSANRHSTSAVRPEHILVEVNALVERRPVSSVLQSAAFRTSIEQSLRGAISSLRANGQVVPGRRDLATSSAVASTSRDNFSTVSHADIGGESLAQSGEEGIAPLVDLPTQPTGSDRAAAWIDQHLLGDQPQRTVAEVVEQMHHEDLIAEISELIHSQLVTSSLHGPIRNVLENQMRNRLEQSGSDGQRVVQQLRQLPRTHVHRRNDFWDLGIIAAGSQQNDNFDEVSVISAAAAVAIPQSYSQSTAVLNHEMIAMRQQMMELKTMMQLSFDLQLDIQRAIRQEVAAAVSAALTTESGAMATSSGPNRSTSAGEAGKCLICLEHAVDTALYQCGHMCLCYSCGMQLRQRGAHCPVCRAPIRDIIRTYHSA